MTKRYTHSEFMAALRDGKVEVHERVDPKPRESKPKKKKKTTE